MSVKYRKLFWSVFLLSMVTSAALVIISVRGNTKSSAVEAGQKTVPVTEAKKAPAFITPSATPTKERLEVELVTLSPTGFYPKQITRPHGKFLLQIDNYSGQRSITLRLEREAGPRLVETQMPLEQRGWSNVMEVPAGNYVVTEANHPNWVCHITVR